MTIAENQRLVDLERPIRYCNHFLSISLLFSTIYKFLFIVTCILLANEHLRLTTSKAESHDILRLMLFQHKTCFPSIYP